MASEWLIAIVVAIGLVVLIVAVRLFQGERSRKAQDRRRADLLQGGADSPAEYAGQREDRRLAGMSADDRAWEQASLQRDRERQERAHAPEGAADR